MLGVGSSSSLLVEDFDSEKDFYSSYPSEHHSSTFLDEFVVDRDEFPSSSDEATSTSSQQCRTTTTTTSMSTTSVEFDPRLGVLIESELGLNDPQTSRKNAWGNLSYAELIAKAIENSQDKRLTLSQIYSWMIQYVPYFRDKGDRKSSTGWKNSIRHNLSLHNRFVRIPNEIAGKSSWWTIDPRAKQVRGRRRIQSNDNSNHKSERRRLTKNISQDTSNNPSTTNPSFDHLFSTPSAPLSSSSNDVFQSTSTPASSSSSSSSSSFTSVRDMNKDLYNLLQSTSQDQSSSFPLSSSLSSSSNHQPILHDMLKSSNLSDKNNASFSSGMDNNSVYSSLSKSPSINCQSPSPSPSHCDYELDQVISTKLSKQLKTMDRSSPLFRRMVVAIMRHQMNKSKNIPVVNNNNNNERRKNILSTPPSTSPTSSSSPSSTNLHFQSTSATPSSTPVVSTSSSSSSSSSSSMELELTHNSQNALPSSTFDLDVEAILDFERTTFGDCSFDIHDLPNL